MSSSDTAFINRDILIVKRNGESINLLAFAWALTTLFLSSSVFFWILSQ